MPRGPRQPGPLPRPAPATVNKEGSAWQGAKPVSPYLPALSCSGLLRTKRRLPSVTGEVCTGLQAGPGSGLSANAAGLAGLAGGLKPQREVGGVDGGLALGPDASCLGPPDRRTGSSEPRPPAVSLLPQPVLCLRRFSYQASHMSVLVSASATLHKTFVPRYPLSLLLPDPCLSPPPRGLL